MGRVTNLALITFVSIITLCLTWSRAEMFTAIADIEPLLDTHRMVINDLDEYLVKEEKRLLFLKKQIDTYKKEHERAMEDVPNYLGNPINAFTLIKRLTKDLEEIDSRIKTGTVYIRNLTLYRDEIPFPSREDLIGAANALTRLQATYRLEVKELAEGLFNGVAYSSSMSAGDCFELGRALYHSGNYKNSADWMAEAYRKYHEEKNDAYSFTEVDILDYASWAHYNLGDFKNALEWTRKLLAVDPNHVRARANLHMFEQQVAQLQELEKRQPDVAKQMNQMWVNKEEKGYEALCRGDYELPQEISKRLTCFYLTENHPFLRLAPIKAEKKYSDPDVYVFYDVISDEEIDHVKYMAQPRFKRAVVHDPTTGGEVPAPYRISKSSWLQDAESSIVERISRRVADFTGLNVDTAENLQVANYGIGGHYEPHYDFARKFEHSFKANFQGNRIATVLFYMSEVAQGGATVFTELGISVFPVKNSALFWMNLHPSGEGDLATRHAACPVLRGSKWVANKWIQLGGQEFKRPCTLEYQPEETMRDIIPSVLKSST